MTPRERAIDWARRIAADPRAVVLDTETLSLNPSDGVCDIAVVSMDGVTILNSLINPHRPIPAEASAIHGIRDADVYDAPTFRDIYHDLRAVLGGRIVLVYNASFDAAVIDSCCDTADLARLDTGSWGCVMIRYSEFDGSQSTNWRRPGLRWWKLGEACAAMGVHLDGAHRARADAEATRRLVLAMAGFAPNPETPPETCGYCGHHVNEHHRDCPAIDDPTLKVAESGGQLPLFSDHKPVEVQRDWTR